MRRVLRENALCALAAAGASAAMAWLGLYGFAWNDYEIEAQPAFNALTHGHVLEFLRLAPAYGGSLVERAPFALLPGLWGGGALAVYRMVAVPCLLAGAALGVWLCVQMRAAGRKTLWRAVVLGVCVANPLTLQALELGHPEELLGACLCVAAVLLASRGRSLWAGVLLGLAIANKEWALIAAGPVLLALPAAGAGMHRWRHAALCLASAGAVVAVVLAPLVLVSPGGFAAGARGAAAPQQALFQPWQVWWFLGRHGQLVQRMFGTTMPGYRIGPAWTSTDQSSADRRRSDWAWRGCCGCDEVVQFARLPSTTLLLLLALVLLLRCMLDTWDTGYYMLPFLIALLSWEALEVSRRPPVLALVSVVLPWLALQGLSARGVSPDLQAALFLVWTLPLATALGLTLYAPERLSRIAGRWRREMIFEPGIRPGTIAAVPAQEMTVSSLGNPVSTS